MGAGMSEEKLKPAAELAKQASKPYPGDSEEYRKARTALLEEEIKLRRHIWRVAEMRRALPLGGEVIKHYRFLDNDGKEHGLADLFGRHDTLISYFWMYGPQREWPCPMCTAFLDSFDAAARNLTQRVALAVIGRSPVSRQLAFAIERGWRFLNFYQCVGDDFPTDYRGLPPSGEGYPQLDVWTRQGEVVRHFWGGSEMDGTGDPGQDARNVPDPECLWNMLDLTPGGRGTDWYPKLNYGADA
jgi:predicted dithiol-disulfide oxidoreductase (DUF899 family)